ncbi:hypothetical protein EJ110_NYTH02688 [Nymphaea thermarum]|nr:hypothetical protein EJ110_NYTH02688 [Nymphaea thermarum]
MKPPTYNDVRTSILKEEVDKVQIKLKDYKKTWLMTDCTIMADNWIDGKSKNLINFLVQIFLKFYNISGVKKTADNLVKLFIEIIKEVGEKNVVQVVTDNVANYKAACMKIKEINSFKHIFWTHCAVHCLVLRVVDSNEKPVMGFLYNYMRMAKE